MTNDLINWELLKRNDAFLVEEIMLMLFGAEGVEFVELYKQSCITPTKIAEKQQSLLEVMILINDAIRMDVFGNFDSSSGKISNPLLPAQKVICWLTRKQIPELIESHGRKIDPQFYDFLP